MAVRTSIAGIGDSGLIRKVFDGFVVVFLLANLLVRFSTIFHYPGYNGYIAALLGLFSGGIFCAFIGILDFYGVISLKWYRFGRTATPGVLHSTFGNRGVFAEFVLTVVPFVLIGFMSKTRRVWIQVLLFGSLVVCEIALILAGARAGWVTENRRLKTADDRRRG